ncbi:type II toxin-antitoxin system Phd/YefM family antitoxin [Andreprevotia chitinilytica]|uniref:type II toxin-antitoxin system Phd/YefM family antitoxin n=1 Tax=Andreprevotia chitinilytica TaxID=396808 RepID=UPI0009FD4518|nr:type II toxin-antitoxin system prevent-host-death family antitoxin [Andreprevotia chitinilytica]
MSVAEAKAKFSELLDAVEAGEEVVVTRRGKPVAKMNAIGKTKPDLSVFEKYRTALPEDYRFNRDELYDR